MAFELIDNVNKTLKDSLKNDINTGSKISVAAASFSIYAFQELKKELEKCEEFRFIFTAPTFITEKAKKEKREYYIPRMNRERNLYGTEFEIKLRNEMTQKAIAKECSEWVKKKAKFRSNITKENMMGFIQVDDKSFAPITEFSTVDLGCERGNNAYSMIQRIDAPWSSEYLRIFDEFWNDKNKLQDVTDQVLDNITTAYNENSPDFIYFVTLYNIFNVFFDTESIFATIDFISNKADESDLIIIGGDLTDKCIASRDSEIRDKAIRLLTQLANLNRRIMFIPGNHDIDQSEIVNGEPLNDDKYKVIKSIIEDVNNKVSSNKINCNLSINQAIVDACEIGNSIVMGINSTYGIGNKNELGSVNIVQLEKELEVLKNEKYKDSYEEKNKIAVLHHNLVAILDSNSKTKSDNKEGVYGNVDNASKIISIFKKYGIKNVLMGHTHGNQPLIMGDPFNTKDQMHYYIGGSMGPIYRDSLPVFSRFPLDTNGEIMPEIIYCYARVHNEPKWLLFKGDDSFSDSEVKVEDYTSHSEEELTWEEKVYDAQDYLRRCISEHSLFKMGHFENNGQALLSWLDSTEFITSRKRLTKICNYFYLIYNEELNKATDFIGIGMKGTIIVNSIRAMYEDKHITFIPENAQEKLEKDSADYRVLIETLKKISDTNNHHTIVLFTDIYGSGETIKKILSDNIDFFTEKTIFVFCIVDMSENTNSLPDRAHSYKTVTKGLQTVGFEVYSLLKIRRVTCNIGKCSDCELATGNICKVN